jgi:hypothetical protein
MNILHADLYVNMSLIINRMNRRLSCLLTAARGGLVVTYDPLGSINRCFY